MIRLQRQGQDITASHSTNGEEWHDMGTITLDLGAQCYIGLAVSSRRTGSLCETVFEIPFSDLFVSGDTDP